MISDGASASGFLRSVGRYRIYEPPIASGGMATVHLGCVHLGCAREQIGADGGARTLAVKRLHTHLGRDKALFLGLLDEARIAAHIRHPNVVATLEVHEADGEALLVMPYVEGEVLSRLVRATLEQTGQPLRPEIAAAIAIDALDGLHAAHDAEDERGAALGIVHRDVSPQNLIVGVDGVTRVLDFGIAKAAGRLVETTREGHLKGKLPYMAPEQLTPGLELTRAVDVYAMGVVLWEMLAGRRLFTGEDGQLMAAILAGRPPPLTSVAPAITPAFDAITARALSPAPTGRYPTAKAMAEDIARASPRADATEVASWVQTMAAPALANRARVVKRLGDDCDEVVTAVASPGVHASAPPRAGRVRRAGLLGLGLVAVVPAYLAARHIRSNDVATRGATATAVLVTAPTTSTSSGNDSSQAETPAVSAAGALRPSAKPSSRPPAGTLGGKAAKGGRGKAASCETPFYIEDGLKVARPECLR